MLGTRMRIWGWFSPTSFMEAEMGIRLRGRGLMFQEAPHPGVEHSPSSGLPASLFTYKRRLGTLLGEHSGTERVNASLGSLTLRPTSITVSGHVLCRPRATLRLVAASVALGLFFE